MSANPPLYVDRAHPNDGGKLRYMTQSGGYVMVRRPRCMPFVMIEKKWRNLPAYQEPSA